jgi:lipopolysaccharide transport system ATP-binding protein
MEKGEERTVMFTFLMDLAPGKYTLTVALHSRENHLEKCYHWCDNIAKFEVAGVNGAKFSGVCRLPTSIELIA